MLTTLAAYDNTTVENSCVRGDSNALGALFCEKTCDDILGAFCPNENEYRPCNNNSCPGNVGPKSANINSISYPLLVNCTWGTWSAWDTCSVTSGGAYQWRNRTIIQEALYGGTECENCTDSSTTGNCGIIDILATYDNGTVEDQCDRGNPNGFGALYCEETCDDNLGRFCSNANDYQLCSGNTISLIKPVIIFKDNNFTLAS